MDHGLLGSSVHGILQARILEWVTISFSSDKVRSEWSEWSDVAQLCPTLCDLPILLHPWDFPGKGTGVGCHFTPVKLQLLHNIISNIFEKLRIDEIRKPWGDWAETGRNHPFVHRIFTCSSLSFLGHQTDWYRNMALVFKSPLFP